MKVVNFIEIAQKMGEQMNANLLLKEERFDLEENAYDFHEDARKLATLLNNMEVPEKVTRKQFVHALARMNIYLVDLIQDVENIYEILVLVAKRFNSFEGQNEPAEDKDV